MGKILITFFIFVSINAYAGKLFTFDKNSVQLTGLQYIQSRYQDLAEVELKPFPVQPQIDKKGNLVVNIFFSYVAKNENGIAFACAKIDENANLLNIRRDIPAESVFNLTYSPDTLGC